jgi:copper transport protein
VPAPLRHLPRRHPLLGLLAALALAALAILGTPGVASAHAALIAADPPDGARLDASPAHVQLTFSEHVSASLGGVRVVDSSGGRVDRGAVRVDGSAVEVDLAPHLPDGTYVITYRIVSADGHPVRGATVFGVGSGAVDTDAARKVTAGGNDRRWEVVGAIGRGFAYGGTLLAAGGVLFLVVAHRGEVGRARLRRRVRAAALVGAAASLVALPIQAALGTGQGPGSLFDHGVLGRVMDDGVGLGLGLCLLGLAVAVLTIDRNRAATVAGAALAAASFAATGHTRAGSSALFGTVADSIHLLVVAVWGGGLVLLWSALRDRRRAAPGDGDASVPEEDGGPAGLVLRFSSMATVAVLAAGVTGGALAWNEVRSIHALTSTGYGQMLLAKSAVVALVAALGAYNHFRLMPALAAGKTKAAMRQLGHTLRIEALAVVVVVGLTSVLVVMTPARTEAAGGPVERIIELGDVGSVQLVVAPARAGFNQIHLYTFDPDHRPVELAEDVSLQLTLPSAQLGPIDRTAARAGPAHYQLNGNDLSIAGRWTITVKLRVDRFTQASGTAQVPVAG